MTVQIYVRTSAAECDFLKGSGKNSARNGITKQNTFVLDSSLCGNQGQAGPRRARPSRARLVRDAGSGRLPASCSSWQASEKQLIRLHETHTFKRHLQNRSFRLRKIATFRTPSPYLPWMTHVRLAQRQSHKFPSKITCAPLRQNAIFLRAPQKTQPETE